VVGSPLNAGQLAALAEVRGMLKKLTAAIERQAVALESIEKALTKPGPDVEIPVHVNAGRTE
jgi:hypothetical protein